MQSTSDSKDSLKGSVLTADLRAPWLITSLMLLALVVYVIICLVLGEKLQQPLASDLREFIKSVLYGCAIITFPLAGLLRFILLRLNQTMPLPDEQADPIKFACSRYLRTVLVSAALFESIGLYGLIMFVLGDGYNTLSIFTGLAALGLLLYRPKQHELTTLCNALAEMQAH